MKNDYKLIAEAYSKILDENKFESMSPEEQEAYEDKLDKKEAYKASLMNDEGTDEKQKSMSYLLTIANNLFEVGSRIKSGSTTPADAEYLIDASVEIEDIYNKYLSV